MARLMKGGSFPFLLILPSVVLMLGLVGYPVLTMLRYSVLKYNLITPPTFVGFNNYIYLVTGDPFFWKVILNTAIWTVVNVACEFLLGLLIALSVNQADFARSVFRGLLILPWIVTPVTSGLIWSTLLSVQTGPFDAWLNAVGLQPVDWLGSVHTSLLSLSAVTVWKQTPLVTVSLLAGLVGIPTERYEACAVDGANRWHTFWWVTIPGIAPMISVTVLISVIWRASDFDLINVLTKGGPAYSTELITPYAYDKAIGQLHVGMGSALTLIGVFLLLIVVGPFVRRLMNRDFA